MGTDSPRADETAAAVRGPPARARERNRIGWPRSSTANIVTGCSASASAFIAPRPSSWAAAGKAHALPSRVMSQPPRVLARITSSVCAHAAVHVEIVTRSTVRAAELIRRPVAKLLELVVDRDDADVGGTGNVDRRRRLTPATGQRQDGAARIAPAAPASRRRSRREIAMPSRSVRL